MIVEPSRATLTRVVLREREREREREAKPSASLRDFEAFQGFRGFRGFRGFQGSDERASES